MRPDVRFTSCVAHPPLTSTTRRRRASWRTFCAKLAMTFALLAGLAPNLSAQEMAVPVEVQTSVFLRVLQFDRDLADRAGDELVIGIAYQRRNRASLNARDAILGASRGEQSVMGIRVKYVTIALTGDGSLGDSLGANKVDVLYIPPLRSLGLERVIAAAEAHGVLTWTGVVEYVGGGVAVGVGAKGGRPEIVINLDAAKAAGVRFSSQLLKLARLVDGNADGSVP